MTDPTVTIAIPVYNREAMLRRTLDSVAAQTHRPLKVVLVDNNSTDSSLAVMHRWAQEVSAPGFEVEVLAETTPGAAAARNKALGAVTTPWVMFFDSDDTMAPGHVARAMDALQANPRCDIIGWDVRLHGLGPRPVVKPFITHDPLYYGVQLGTMATLRYMCRTGLMRRAGGWDASMRGWDDIELGVRMLALSPAPRLVKVNGAPTVDVNCHGSSITGSDFAHHLDDLCRAVAAMYRNLPAHRRSIARLKLAILAACVARETRGTDPRPRKIIDAAAADAPSRTERMALRFAYTYTKAGGRGAARLLHPLLRP